MKIIKIFAGLLMVVPVVVTVSLILVYQPSDRLTGFADPIIAQRNFSSDLRSEDKLLGGLVAAGFYESSCLSRNYEARHKHCGPYTKSYNKTVEQLNSRGHTDTPMDCRYVVWVSYSGLGNRILTLAAAFLYALLTDRVLLVERGKDMADLFCEPFPQTTWWLPLDLPVITQFGNFNQEFSASYGNMLKNNKISNLPSSLYLYLAHDYGDYDKLFFCDDNQINFRKVPWLIMKTDEYFIPSLFLIPSFQDELSKLFPNKVTIFHHLGRYLFHPSNHVWGLITRYYETHLAKADDRIGIQVRIFDTGTGPFQHVIDQILGCVHGDKLLPAVDRKRLIIQSGNNARVKAVLVTCLTSGYFETLKDLYWEHPTVSGDMIRVVQPSNEHYQHVEDAKHNMKALAEMYLLSLTDVLVTSAWSTFGYVAQGLGGLKPWILYKPENRTVPNPPCGAVMSMEPCFHAPPFYDCKTKSGIDTGKILPHVRHCEDISWGLKVVDEHNNEFL